ncbi:MAG: hypothetical protein AAB460_01030 [Patescibacteria group bacterium]
MDSFFKKIGTIQSPWIRGAVIGLMINIFLAIVMVIPFVGLMFAHTISEPLLFFKAVFGLNLVNYGMGNFPTLLGGIILFILIPCFFALLCRALESRQRPGDKFLNIVAPLALLLFVYWMLATNVQNNGLCWLVFDGERSQNRAFCYYNKVSRQENIQDTSTCNQISTEARDWHKGWNYDQRYVYKARCLNIVAERTKDISICNQINSSWDLTGKSFFGSPSESPVSKEECLANITSYNEL